MATIIKQDRSVSTDKYRFNGKEHLHELLKDGKWQPLTGVTTVLSVIAKPMLIQWAANMACDYIDSEWMKVGINTIPVMNTEWQRIIKEARTAHRKKKEAAGDWGTKVHSNIESYINHCINFHKGEACGEEAEFIQDTPSEKNFIKWAIDNKVKFLASEKNVWSEKMWVGGIADIICEIEGKRFVGDIKTSSGIYPEHFIQVSAYAEMLNEMGYGFEDAPVYPKITKTQMFDGVIILNLKKDGTFDYQYNYDLEGNFNCFKAALTLYKHLNQLK